MANDNRIRAKNPWTIPVLIGAVVLLGAIVLCGVFMTSPEDTEFFAGPSQTVKRASSQDLYCLEYTVYSGAYVEDGTNEQVENVAAILVENRSDEFLERATVTYYVGGEVATFEVTGLPSGESAWVLEKNRMSLESGDEFTFLDCTSTFRQDVIQDTEELSVSTQDNVITMRNESGKTLKNPCIYYKTVNSDGYYLGGITYMIAFDELGPGETAEKQSAHFSDDSKIVRYSYQTE